MNITTYLLESFLFRIHNPVNCIIPGLPVPHHLPDLPKFMSTAWWCYPPISSSVVLFCFCLQPFPASGFFPKIWLFASGKQSTGSSASASVLPMSIQSWFHLDWLIWSSCCPRDYQKSSPAPQFKNINSSALCLFSNHCGFFFSWSTPPENLQSIYILYLII